MTIVGQMIAGFILLVFPLQTLAAPRVIDVILAPDEEFITRGEFIRGAVKVLGFPLKEGDSADLSRYLRIPRGYLPYIGVAHKHGALETFEDDLLLGQPIKRGEALIFLVKLMDISSEGKSKRPYRDVHKGSIEERAVVIALAREWMKPLTIGLFGVERSLTGKEGRLLLSRIGAEPDLSSSVKVPKKIQIRFEPPQVYDLPGREILRTIWQILNDQFLYGDALDADEAAFKAAEAIIGSVKDPYTTFMRPRSSQEFQRQIQGEVSGIGAQVEYINEILTIISPLPGSPALQIGLKPGDQILEANGEKLSGIGFIEAVDKVRGEKGSSVKLRIRRNGAEFDVTVIRDTIRVPEIDISVQDGIIILKLIQFGRMTETELRDLLARELETRKSKGLILDLRNNPGGLLHAATIVASVFLPQGSVVAKIVTRDGETKEMTDDPPVVDPDLPVVVLVNNGSASASEIVAGALQDVGRATVVGEKTFGKGTVQQVLEFTDGSSMKLTIAEWLTPLGRKIDNEGVNPDIKVEPEDGRDVQLLKALQLLR